MSGEKKFLIGIGVITVAIIGAGVFFFSGQGSSPASKATTQKVDQAQVMDGAKHTIGDPNAKVKIVEFGDYQCPACGAAYPIVKSILDKNKDKVYFVFRNFPLTQAHPNAQAAAKAAEAAGLQGKYWEMHDKLYENQTEWSSLSGPMDKFKEYAKSIGIDDKKFASDFDGTVGTINSDYNLGIKISIESTPTFVINGKMYPGVLQNDQFQKIIDDNSK